MQHQLVNTQDTIAFAFRCSVCGVGWKQEPISECPGCQLYHYEKVPWETMTTVTQLREKRLKPKDKSKPDGCYYREKKHDYIYLYRIEEAIPIPEPTEKQQAALVKANEALKAKYSCEKCGYYDRSHGQSKYTRLRTIKIDDVDKRYCQDCIENIEWWKERSAIEQRMKELLESDELVAILDTETTGLPMSEYFQVVEVSIIDKHGTVLFDSLIKPICDEGVMSIPPSASSIHGITDEMVACAPTFAEVWTELEKILSTHSIWCYNADFDRQAIIHSAYHAKVELSKEIKKSSRWRCMMFEYAEYYGDWSEHYQSYRWQQLALACQDLGVEGSGYHRALGDVNNTLGVMKALAARVDQRKSGEGVKRFKEEDEY